MNSFSQPVVRVKEEIHFNNENALKTEKDSTSLSQRKSRSPTESVSNDTSKKMDIHARSKGAIETSCASSNGNGNMIDTKNFDLEPLAAWERANCGTTGKQKTRTAEAHHEIAEFRSNTSPHGNSINRQREYDKEENTAMPSSSLFRRPEKILHRFKSNRKVGTTDTRTQPRPTINEIKFLIDSDYFMDGKELERNVVIDHTTNRSYVYTTDLQAKWMMPEFLYLDVPNSTYAARACGQFVTDKLAMELYQMVKPGTKQPSVALEGLVKNCNKSSYEVKNIYVPYLPSRHGYQPNVVSVRAITAKFRLRYARSGTSIHRMLCHNFMNGNRCSRGILVFIPSMEKGGQADRFWGTLEDVKDIPDINESITNAKMDRWCTQIAKRLGTFRGRDPEMMGVAVRYHHDLGPHPYQSYDLTNLTSSRKINVEQTPAKKVAQKAIKVALAKKKIAPKMNDQIRIQDQERSSPRFIPE